MAELDALDVRLIQALHDQPRAGVLELSRQVGVSRATVQARLERLERSGVVTGYGPDIDLPAAGYSVLAFATLEIAQGRLDEVAEGLHGVPAVLEAYATTGTADVHCQIAARSNDELQDILLTIDQIPGVARSTSVIALRRVVGRRTIPLLTASPRREPSRIKSPS